jgi:hypothetical protein
MVKPARGDQPTRVNVGRMRLARVPKSVPPPRSIDRPPAPSHPVVPVPPGAGPVRRERSDQPGCVYLLEGFAGGDGCGLG